MTGDPTDDPADAPTDDANAPPEIIAGRYLVGKRLGEGGAGVVYEASVEGLGRMVALKLLRPEAAEFSARVRREVRSLRLLRLPGVVSLLDEGKHDGRTFLVMDLVDGTAFPGIPRPCSWEDLAPRALSLLDVLSRVHAAGVVHRDLKPSNIIVDAQGRATLCDFGLAFGPSLGARITSVGAFVGTPEYVAPEQILGEAADARADLYAFGTILYEALAGRLPFGELPRSNLFREKVSRSPTPLRRAVALVPAHVAQTVDALLHPDPTRRPQTCGTVFRALSSQDAFVARHELPRLGSPDLVASIAGACLDGRSTCIAGARGSGRSRLLTDVAAEVERSGRTVHWVSAGEAPLGGLAWAAPDAVPDMEEGLDPVIASYAEAVRGRLGAGDVVFADDSEALDPWTTRVLEACRDGGAIVTSRVAGDGADHHLEPLTERDLRALFSGPERVLHLPTDAASELWRRTAGIPARVTQEVGTWVREGVAHWRGTGADARLAVVPKSLRSAVGATHATSLRSATRARRLEGWVRDVLAWLDIAWPHLARDEVSALVDAPAWQFDLALAELDRRGLVCFLDDGRIAPTLSRYALEVWDESMRQGAQRAVARALESPSRARLEHLVLGGMLDEATEEAIALGGQLVHEGRADEAESVLASALSLDSSALPPEVRERLLLQYVEACTSTQSPGPLRRAHYEVSRRLRKQPELAALNAALAAAIDVDRTPPEEALRRLTDCGPLGDSELEVWRQSRRGLCARRIGAARCREILDEIEQQAAATGNEGLQLTNRSWRGSLLYAEGEYAAAAEEHLAVAARKRHSGERLPALLNAAASLIEAGELDRAARAAEEARDVACDSRHAAFELRAEWLLRAIRYRADHAVDVDHELVAIADTLDDAALRAQIRLNEAAVGWRTGDLATAAELASESSRLWAAQGRHAGALLTAALAHACAPDDANIERPAASDIAACALPRVAAQVAALCNASAPVDGAVRAKVLKYVDGLDPAVAARRGEVMSLDEVRAALA